MKYVPSPDNFQAENRAEKVRHLMSTGQTSALLEWLLEQPGAAIPLIRERLYEAQQAYLGGSLMADMWVDIQLQAYQALLKLPEFTRGHVDASAINRLKIETLLLQGQFEKALEHCSALGDAALLLHAQLCLLRQEHALGRLDLPEWELAVHRFSFHILNLVEQHATNQKPSQKWWKRLIKRLS